MITEKDCVYFMPKEITRSGISCCALFSGACNHYGKKCVGFAKHTKKTRQVLKELIELKKNEGQKGEDIKCE